MIEVNSSDDQKRLAIIVIPCGNLINFINLINSNKSL